MRNISILLVVAFVMFASTGCVYQNGGFGNPYYTSTSNATNYKMQREQLKQQYLYQLQQINEKEHLAPATSGNKRYYNEQRRLLRTQYNNQLKQISENERNQRKLDRENARRYRNSAPGIFQQEFQAEKKRFVRRAAREAARDFFRF